MEENDSTTCRTKTKTFLGILRWKCIRQTGVFEDPCWLTVRWFWTRMTSVSLKTQSSNVTWWFIVTKMKTSGLVFISKSSWFYSKSTRPQHELPQEASGRSDRQLLSLFPDVKKSRTHFCCIVFSCRPLHIIRGVWWSFGLSASSSERLR